MWKSGARGRLFMGLAIQRVLQHPARASGTFAALAGYTEMLFQIAHAAHPFAGSGTNLATGNLLTDANIH
jgi:hypothetical protein